MPVSTVLIPEAVNSPTFFAPESHNLTTKQKSFADNYLQSRNGVESARAAGYDGNDATLRAIASENLTKPNIRAYLEECYGQRVIGSNEVLAELSAMATVNLDDTTVIKAADKLKALELAGKFYKHWDRDEKTPAVTINIERLTLAQVIAGAIGDAGGEPSE